MENEIILFETNDNAIKLEVPVEGGNSMAECKSNGRVV